YFILAARSATSAVMFFIPALVLASYQAVSRRPGDRKTLVLMVVCTAISVYVPGLFWLVILGSTYKRSRLKEAFAETELKGLHYSLLALLTLVIWIPIIIG